MDGNVSEHAPICGLALDAAIKWAKEAYGEDAGVVIDQEPSEGDKEYMSREIYWVFGEFEG